ncbi:uncharacterized protein [Miscanthus floridulus]|uniref:uncharacterized protein n=1 Tax=Miscanthus floridulus TaxID=154761 RepID=UPI00345AEB1C
MELVDTYTSKMMMRSANAICLVAFIVFAAAAFTTAEAAAAAAATAPGSAQAAAAGPAPTNSPPPSPAAVEFLQGRCSPGVMPEVIARHCYDSLLPQTGTFNGSCIRVIGAATELMVANFRSFLAELRQLNSTKQGAGYKLGKCADQAADFAGGEPGKEPRRWRIFFLYF